MAIAKTAVKSRIPKISNKRLKELSDRIKPVVCFAEGENGLSLLSPVLL